MDFGTINSIFTVIVFVAFVGIVLWAYDGRSKARFDAAARIPLDDDDEIPGAQFKQSSSNAREKNNA